VSATTLCGNCDGRVYLIELPGQHYWAHLGTRCRSPFPAPPTREPVAVYEAVVGRVEAMRKGWGL